MSDERCPVCGARAAILIDFGKKTIEVEHDVPLCGVFEDMRGLSPFTCNVAARASREPVPGEHCWKCERARPTVIADPTCAVSGYCEWVGGPPS